MPKGIGYGKKGMKKKPAKRELPPSAGGKKKKPKKR